MRGGIDSVRQPGQLRMKIAPEFEAVDGRKRQTDRAEAGDVLLPHPAIDAARLGKADPQPAAGRSTR